MKGRNTKLNVMIQVNTSLEERMIFFNQIGLYNGWGIKNGRFLRSQ